PRWRLTPPQGSPAKRQYGPSRQPPHYRPAITAILPPDKTSDFHLASRSDPCDVQLSVSASKARSSILQNSRLDLNLLTPVLSEGFAICRKSLEVSRPRA